MPSCLRGCPKILDFGLARLLDPQGDATQITQAGTFHGTLAYASPEQVRGDVREIDVRSDVYSLGVMLYELVTGVLPYDLSHSTFPAAARLICEYQPIHPSRVRVRSYAAQPNAPRRVRPDGEVDAITLKCLEKDPQRRYQSAAELAGDLRRYLAGEPISARRESLSYVARKWLARHRTGSALTALLAVLLGGSLWGIHQSQEASRATAEAAVQGRISALRSAQLTPADLERPGTPAAGAAASIWALVQEGRATEAEMAALAEVSVRFDFVEPSLLDLSKHAVREGGYAIRYATRVYACPDGYGFLVRPIFKLDDAPLPPQRAPFRAAQRRLPFTIHATELGIGQHVLIGTLEVTLARIEGAGEAPRTKHPISPTFSRPLGPYQFAAVAEHPPGYPVRIPVPAYQERFAEELQLSARVAPEPPLPRQPAADRDELQVILALPPPPLELALRVDLHLGDFELPVELAIAASGADGPPELVFHNGLLVPHFDPAACRITLRVPLSALQTAANPDALVGAALRVELGASRDAARSADFERFLDVSFTAQTSIGDAREP